MVAGLTPLLRVPREDGVPSSLHPARCALSGGKERDFCLASDDPFAPRTCGAKKILDDKDCIAASAMMSSQNRDPALNLQ